MPNKFEQWSQEFQLVFPRGALWKDRGRVLRRFRCRSEFVPTLPAEERLPLSDSHSTYGNPAAALFGQATVHLRRSVERDSRPAF
jgi:hypothetical protein